MAGFSEDITAWADQMEAACAALPDDPLGSAKVFVYARTASTQDAAWRHRRSDGAVIAVASEQTAGRGQRGRRWDDGRAMTLPISFAWPTPLHDVALSARVGLAALDACREAAPGPDIRIKWPNDIVVRDQSGDRKLAGVLIERRDGWAVVGVGINVIQAKTDLERAGLLTACSLGMLNGTTDRISLAVGLTGAMSRWLSANDAEVREHWDRHDAMKNRTHQFVLDREAIEGTVTRVDPLHAITVRCGGVDRALPVDRTTTLRPEAL